MSNIKPKITMKMSAPEVGTIKNAEEGWNILCNYAAKELTKATENNDAMGWSYFMQLADLVTEPRTGMLLGPLVMKIPELIEEYRKNPPAPRPDWQQELETHEQWEEAKKYVYGGKTFQDGAITQRIKKVD